MPEDAKPTAATVDASPARDADIPEQPKGNAESAQSATPKQPTDKAQVSGQVEPSAPTQPAAKTALSKEQKALADALAVHEKNVKATEASRLAVEMADRVVKFRQGQKAIHSVLLKAQRTSREGALSAFEVVGDENEKTAIQAYLVALNSMPDSPAKKAVDQSQKD